MNKNDSLLGENSPIWAFLLVAFMFIFPRIIGYLAVMWS